MTFVPAAPQVAARLRRARVWLVAAFFIHSTTAVFTLFAAAGGSIHPAGVAIAAGALVVLPSVLLLWWERREPTARRPARWLRRGLGVILPHAAGFGIAACVLFDRSSPLTWQRIVLFACVPLVIEIAAIGMASRALRRPLASELGEMDIEVQVAIRSSAKRQPAWLSHDDVRLTADSILITVRPGPRWAFVECIPLEDVVDVGSRRPTDQDGPWFVSDDGHTFLVPPSEEVLVITHARGEHLLPVHHAVEFADVVRARLAAGEWTDRTDGSTSIPLSPA